MRCAASTLSASLGSSFKAGVHAHSPQSRRADRYNVDGVIVGAAGKGPRGVLRDCATRCSARQARSGDSGSTGSRAPMRNGLDHEIEAVTDRSPAGVHRPGVLRGPVRPRGPLKRRPRATGRAECAGRSNRAGSARSFAVRSYFSSQSFPAGSAGPCSTIRGMSRAGFNAPGKWPPRDVIVTAGGMIASRKRNVMRANWFR